MASESGRGPEQLVADLRAALAGVADPERAPAMAAYMKHHFTFFGVQSKDRRAAQRPTIAELGAAIAAMSGVDQGDALLAFATVCWDEPERELQYVGADALRKHQAVLEPVHLDDVRRLIITKSWWDTVDSLAAHTVGPLVARHPELAATMDVWIDDENIWLARTAIIHQLGYKEATDADRLFAYATARAGDTEFFIRKALGWALRQYGRVDPDGVRSYVAENDDQLSGLTKREALKRL